MEGECWIEWSEREGEGEWKGVEEKVEYGMELKRIEWDKREEDGEQNGKESVGESGMKEKGMENGMG